jgi:hypothetical protein
MVGCKTPSVVNLKLVSLKKTTGQKEETLRDTLKVVIGGKIKDR